MKQQQSSQQISVSTEPVPGQWDSQRTPCASLPAGPGGELAPLEAQPGPLTKKEHRVLFSLAPDLFHGPL